MEKMQPDFKTAYCVANEILLQSHTIETIPFDIKVLHKTWQIN